MASARQKCGKWYYRITVTVGDGSHKYIERGGFKTKREALSAGQKVELAYKDGDSEVVNKSRVMTFSCLSDEWLESTRNTYKESTIRLKRITLDRFVNPVIGDFTITAITYKSCQDVIDKMVETHHAKSRIEMAKSVMNVIFAYAIRCGYLKQSPSKNVQIPAVRSVAYTEMRDKKRSDALPRAEINAIFKRFPEGHVCYIPLVLGYRCGLRIGEAFGLLIDDIDFIHSQLHIRRQIQFNERTRRWWFSPPKYCREGEGRDVDLDPETVRILKRHVKKLLSCMTTFHHKIYYVDKDGYLNDQGDGKAVNLVNVRYEDGSYINEFSMYTAGRVIHGQTSKIDYVDPQWHFHELRHTHASECIAAGMNPVSVQNRLGHKALRTTFQYYVHETEEERENSKEILDKMFA